eukprot:4598557-Amphidinium_carterae.1
MGALAYEGMLLVFLLFWVTCMSLEVAIVRPQLAMPSQAPTESLGVGDWLRRPFACASFIDVHLCLECSPTPLG